MKTVIGIKTQLKAEDEAFRPRLLQDPRGTIHEVVGLTVPKTFSVNVHEESATDFHIVLPPAGGRISDQEMREPAGGFGTLTDW